MRHASVIVLGLAWLCSPQLANAQDGGVTLVTSPEQTIRNFLIPFSKGDRAAFMRFFADDATVFFPDGPQFPAGRVQGRSAIDKAFSVMPANADRPTIEPNDLQVLQFDSTAIVTFHLTRGRRTFVLRRTGSGWEIVHLHGSNVSRSPVQ